MFTHVYDKGQALAPHGLVDPTTRITPLPNVGREAETWLAHICGHYHDLAEWTFLAQGDPHQAPGEFRRRLAVPYADTTGLTREYMAHFPADWIKAQDLAEWHQPADGGPPVEVRYGRAIFQGGRRPEENETWLRRLWAYFFACPPPEPLADWTFAYGAQYAVPRHRITDRPLAFWQWCRDAVRRPEHAAEHTWASGWAFELLWRYLLGDAQRWPHRLPDADLASARVVFEVENCRYGDGRCGCDGAPARRCSHPIAGGDVRRRDCLDCPFRPALGF